MTGTRPCDIDNRFVDEDFMDSSHLTEKGAKKFSKIIKEEVLERKVPSAL